jgi:DNA-binding NarL/FixJ family response regulator
MVLTDFSLPDKHGLEFIKDLQTLYPATLVLVVSMHDERLHAERVLRAGARGYIMKNEGGEKLLEAIRQVFAGRTYVSPSMSSRILEAFSGRRQQAQESAVSILTDREFEVFQLIGQGMTTREISRQLRLSPKTVETHRLHIREKMKVQSGPELIKEAVRWAGAQELI